MKIEPAIRSLTCIDKYLLVKIKLSILKFYLQQ